MTHEVETTLTKGEVERAIRQLTYRKLYAKRPDVREARRLYNRRRQETVRLALEAYRRSLEGGK